METKHSRSLWAYFLAACVATTGWVVVASADAGTTDSTTTDRIDAPTEVCLPNGEPGGKVVPLPPGARLLRYGPDGQLYPAATGRGGAEKLVYSNTPPLEPPPDGGLTGVLFARGAGLRIADDLVTNEVDPCTLSNFEVGVSGGGDGGGFFDVTLALWDDCPNSGGQIIPGTERTYTFLSDVSDVILLPLFFEGESPTEPIELPTSVWLSGEFSTNNAGFVIGKPPEVGFSADRYDDPQFPCLARIGTGFPSFPHSSFYARLTAEDPCATHFLAYLADSTSALAVPNGRGVRFADDIELGIDDGELCELSTYELGMRGTGGSYNMRIDLRPPGLLNAIPDTAWISRNNSGNGQLQVARFDAPEGIFLPKNFWITWQPNRDSTGAVLVGETKIGSSSINYAFFDEDNLPNPIWQFLRFPGSNPAIFYVAVNCRGDAPLGACCRKPKTGDAEPICANDVPKINCLDGRWAAGLRCEDEPFFPPCGTAACCTPSGCQDLTYQDCIAVTDRLGRPSIWQSGSFCGVGDQQCYNFECYYSTQDCFQGIDLPPECTTTEECIDQGLGACTCGDGSVPDLDAFPPTGCEVGVAACRFKTGCRDLICCDKICRQDSACCDPDAGWDSACAAAAGAEEDGCDVPPANDMCWHPDWPAQGAERVFLDETGNAVTDAFMEFASVGPDSPFGPNDPNALPDPKFCCNKLGSNAIGWGTLWYYFIAESNSMRITTCGSSRDPDMDSIIEVLEPETEDFRIEPICRSLVPITCNDDAGEGCVDPSGRPQPANSSVCVKNLTIGKPYIVLVGASAKFNTTPKYQLKFTSPCPNLDEIPDNSSCGTTSLTPPIVAPADSVLDVPFDLAGAQFECPGEPCVPAMSNNVWWEYPSPCAGLLNVETCEDTAALSPDTTVAIYTNDAEPNLPCPRDGAELLGCNNDAPVNAEEHEVRSQTCVEGLAECDTSADCDTILTCSGTRTCQNDTNITCVTDRDCPAGDSCTPPTVCLVDEDCPEGEVCEDADFLGLCSQSGKLCRNALDCVNGACRDNGDDCTVGHNETCPLVCSVSNSVCQVDEDCNPNGVGQETCNSQICGPVESCIADTCQSSCGSGSTVTVPVNFNQRYTIRLGGEVGSEPVGNLRFTCMESDCNSNGTSDVLEADCDGNGIPDQCDVNINDPDGDGVVLPDCNENGTPDSCDINPNDPDGDGLVSEDANTNQIPDECEGGACPDGAIVFLDPTTGTPFASQPPAIVDARQPYPSSDAAQLQGFDVFEVTGPAGADSSCWSLCETSAAGTNGIASVVETAPGSYVITLNEKLLAGATTTLTYTTDGGTATTGRFTALPGDVDGSGQTGASDIGSLVDCLNGVRTCAFWECDIDHTPPCVASDIGILVDLLNGAGQFISWNLAVPDVDNICP